jgi:[ribosomal protein S5]-alanine N-acetyltransferase
MTRIETARTILRPFEESDAEAAFAWFSDAEVMRYIPHGADTTPEDSCGRIARYRAHEAKHGFSKWIILDKATATPIGDSGFYTLSGEELNGKPRAELGYRFARDCWGRGLATEVATRWLEVAAPWYGFTQVFAFAHPDHRASLHVIQKLGFTYSHRETFYGLEAPLYVREVVRDTMGVS